jgi:hypothetical protein
VIEEEQIKLRGMSGEQLYKHIMSMGWWSRNKLASDTGTPVEVLIILVNDEDGYVRYGVAQNPSTPATTLVKLAEDADYYVRQAILNNPNTPEAVKIWIRNGFAGLSLVEFLTGINHGP